MAKKDDLFAPPSEDEILMASEQDDDLFAPPSDEEILALDAEPEDDDGIMSKIPSEVKGTTLGAISGKVAEKTLEKAADYLPEASERMAARALGLFDTVEGRKHLKEQASQLGLPKGAISPESIGRLALDENWLGTFGFKSSADQLEDIDSSMLDSIKRKQDLLDKVRGTKELSTITKKTQDIIGPLDIDLDPDAPKIEKAIYDEFEKSFDEDGRFIPKYKTAKELEDAKVRLQERQKYQATRADSAQDRIEKARARALREGTEELVELEGLGDEFKNIKSEIGSKGVARKVALGKSIKDLKSYDLDMGSATSLALGRPEIPLTRMALRKGTAPIAKAMDLGAKVLSSKPVRTVLRGLPVLGAYAGFEAARAEGLSASEAAGRTAIEEARDLALGPISALFGGDTGAKKNSIEYKLESGEPLTDEERKELAKRSNEFMKNQMINNPDKVDFNKVADEYKSKLGEKATPIYNQLMSIANEKDTRRKKAKMHFLTQRPDYKKLTDMLENKQVEDIKMSQEIMSVDPKLQENENNKEPQGQFENSDNLEVFNERKKTIDLENEKVDIDPESVIQEDINSIEGLLPTDIIKIQSEIGVEPDGIFGKNSKKALKEYQEKTGKSIQDITRNDDNKGMLEPIELDNLLQDIGYRESANNYKTINDSNYVGKYQFGAQALETLGYIKPGTYEKNKSNKTLNQSENWTGKDGIDSLEDFLNDKAAQEKAMLENLVFNYRQLKRQNIDMDNLPEEEVAGLLTASHLQGAGGASKFYKESEDRKDALGTKTSDYYKLGKKFRKQK